jgi:hypothetical protein
MAHAAVTASMNPFRRARCTLLNKPIASSLRRRCGHRFFNYDTPETAFSQGTPQ